MTRLENLHALAGDHGAAQPAHQFLAFARKHGSANRFDPASIARDKIHRSLCSRILSCTADRAPIHESSASDLPETLDHTQPEAARASLNDLVRINRYLGGYRVLRSLFSPFAGREDRFSVLDVGAASGDMGAALRRRFPQAVVTSFDYKSDHLAGASDAESGGRCLPPAVPR